MMDDWELFPEIYFGNIVCLAFFLWEMQTTDTDSFYIFEGQAVVEDLDKNISNNFFMPKISLYENFIKKDISRVAFKWRNGLLECLLGWVYLKYS